jgi:hypothetical protein
MEIQQVIPEFFFDSSAVFCFAYLEDKRCSDNCCTRLVIASSSMSNFRLVASAGYTETVLHMQYHIADRNGSTCHLGNYNMDMPQRMKIASALGAKAETDKSIHYTLVPEPLPSAHAAC